MQQEVVISGRSNPTVKRYAALSDKKYRSRERLFLCEGSKLFYEAVNAGVEIEAVLLSENCRSGRVNEALEKMSRTPLYDGTAVYRLSESVFEKVSSEKSPDGVVAVAKYLDNFRNIYKIEESAVSDYSGEKIMILSSLRDPGNVGTVLRSAAAFGFDRVIMSSDCADLYNSRTHRAAMGALFRIKADIFDDLSVAVDALIGCGRRVFAAELRDNAVSLDTVDLLPSDCFVIGNEGHGIPAELSALCSKSVYIPIAATSESLNAAMAATVLAFAQRG